MYRRGPDEIPARKDELVGRDRGGHRDPLQHPAGRLSTRWMASSCFAAYGPSSASPATTDAGRRRRPELRARRSVRTRDPRHRPEDGLRASRRARAHGRREGPDRLGLDAHQRSEGLCSRRRRLRTVDDRQRPCTTATAPPTTSSTSSRAIGDPLPYRTPYKTRRVPVAQDALWEVFAREHQEFHGLGANPIAFPEIESTYNDETAKREAARCYRCDAETGSADYNVRTREDIFVMARTKPDDARKQRAVFTKPLTVSNATHFHPEVAIARRHRLPPGESLAARHRPVPRRVPRRRPTSGGARPCARRFSSPASTRHRRRCARAVAHGAEAGARLRRTPPARRRRARGSSWSSTARTPPTPAATAMITALPGRRSRRLALRAPARSQLLGHRGRCRRAAGGDSVRARARATTCSCWKASGPIAGAWPELAGAPDLSVMRDAIRILRELNREEDIDAPLLRRRALGHRRGEADRARRERGRRRHVARARRRRRDRGRLDRLLRRHRARTSATTKRSCS